MESASITGQSRVNKKNEEAVGQLFATGTVAALPIGVYLNWASSGPGTYPRDLAMPPIQRGFVWKARQIQDLWDSLLRGMPIGAVMVKGFAAGQLGGKVARQRELSPSLQAGYHLIDGQQRTLSMLLGFPQETLAEHKLWVDFSAPGVKGLAFRLRVSTRAHPFGCQLDGSRLSTGERGKAYDEWKKKNENLSFDRIFDNSKPWKANAANQAALFEIKQLWKMLDDKCQDLAQWAEQVEKTIEEGGGALTPQVKATIVSFGQALAQLQNQSLALIKIPHVEMGPVGQDLEADGEDYLTMLFTRIATGGTRLSAEDLLFSMIKHHWPEAHRLVYDVQQQVGALMKPTDFVMTAYRMAALFSSERIADEPRPKAASFHRHLARLQAQTSSLSLHGLVVEGLLARHFAHLRECLAYQGGEDYGLPQAMLAYLDVPLLQVLIYWLLKSPTGRFELSERHDLVRFVLYWRTCCGDASSRQDASKRAIAFLARHDDTGSFPGVELYRLLSHDREGSASLFCELVAPPDSVGCSVRLQHPHARAQAYFGASSTLYKRFCARPQLLIWFQRAWMEAQCCPDGEFPWFKPLAGQDGDNVPYDFDHLVPQSNWLDLRGRAKPKGDKEDIKTFETLESRRALGNSIGNYRVFTATGNRRRGDKSLEALFTLEPPGAMSSQNWQFFAFDDNLANRQSWGEASPAKDPYVWHTDRMMTFQKVVEARALMLYRRLYQEAGFAAWELAAPEFPLISPAM